MEQIGATTPTPLAVLGETVSSLRGLLAGERVTAGGKHVNLEELALGFPPEEVPPILVGTTGPAGLKLAGRSSDGLLLPELASPDAIRWAREEMDRAGDVGTTAIYAMLSVKGDRASALAQTRPRIQRLVDFQIFPRLMEIAGLGADGSGEMTDAILQTLSASGTPEDCAKAVEQWAAAGADRIVFVGGDDDPRESYRSFAADVLPQLR
jgi:alkanesulfonate monooxygenase SsuD/methylene tetrahydromethanopterin reductase-like flavin-dependent oxidoreductase (luciferase family)